MSGTTSQGHKKRSGIPIAPSGTESAAGRDDAKRPPPSPMRWDRCGCRERFPRKDPGVLDLLGSSLSCDTTGLTLPTKHLCLRDTELCITRAQAKRRTSSGFSSCTLQRSRLLPPLGLERLPHLFCGILPQIPMLLEQWRTFRHQCSDHIRVALNSQRLPLEHGPASQREAFQDSTNTPLISTNIVFGKPWYLMGPARTTKH